MRAIVVALTLLPLLPVAAAGGLTAPSAAVVVDAPLLTPVSAETTGTAAAVDARPALEGPVPATADGIAAGLDRLVQHELTPPRPLGTRLLTAEAEGPAQEEADPLPEETPSPQPEPEPAPRERPAPADEAPPAVVIAPGASPRAAPPPAPGVATAVAPPAAHEPPARWQTYAAAGALLLALAPFALYHRVRARRGHSATRGDVLRTLSERPGLSASELARAMDLDPSTTLYHLRRLAAEGAIVSEGTTRRPMWFVAGALPAERRARWVAERRGHEVLRVVRASPGLPKSGLARALAISRAATDWHLVTLERAGLVRLERKAASVHVFPISF